MNDKLDETDAKIKDEVDIKYQGGLSVQPIRMSNLLSFSIPYKEGCTSVCDYEHWSWDTNLHSLMWNPLYGRKISILIV